MALRGAHGFHYRDYTSITASVRYAAGAALGPVGAAAGAAFSKDTLYGTAFFAPVGLVLSKLGVSGGTGNVRLALYNARSHLSPGPDRYAHVFGVFSANAFNALGTPVSIPPGAYWMVAQFEANQTNISSFAAHSVHPTLGVALSNNYLNATLGIAAAAPFGVGMPEFFPAFLRTTSAINFQYDVSAASFRHTEIADTILPAEHFRHVNSADLTAHHGCAQTPASATANNGAADTLYANPVPTGRGGQIDALVTRNVANGVNLKLGIYETVDDVNGDLYPDGLVATVNGTSAGGTTTYAFGSPIDVPPDRLWYLAAIADAVANSATQFTNPRMVPQGILSVAQSYAGGLPATFPAGATRSDGSTAGFAVLASLSA